MPQSVEEIAKLTVIMEALGFDKANAQVAALETMMAEAKAELVASSEREALAIQHEIEMLAHEERQLNATREAQDREIETLARQVAAQLKVEGSGEQIAKTIGKVGDASAQSRVRTQALAYAFNDFFSVSGNLQQRLNAIANNLPGLFAGASPALVNFGLALGAIAPIVGMLITHFDELKKAFGLDVAEMVDGAGRLQKRIKELEETKTRLAVDTAELDAAKQKLKELQAAQDAFDRSKTGQTEEERQKGKQVTETLTEAPGGEEALAGDVKAMLVKEFTATSRPLREAAEKTRALRDLAEKARKAWEESKDPEERAQLAEAFRSYSQQVIAAQDKSLEIQREIAKQAERAYGDAKDRAEKAHGVAQRAGVEDLADLAARAGHRETAEAIRAAQTQKQADDEDKAFERRMQAATDAGARRREIETRKEKAQQIALDSLLKSNTFDEDADKTAREINKKGLSKLQSFEALKAAIQDYLLESLRKQGKAADNAERIAAKAAASEAEKSFARVGQEEKKETKAAAADEKKKTKAAEKEADAETKGVAKETKAEAKLITTRVGDEFQEEYERRLANNAAFAAEGGRVARSSAEQRKLENQGIPYALPDAEAKKQLQDEFASRLRQRGASRAGALVATKDIAEKGDIDLQKDLGQAQGNNQQKLMQVAAQHNATFAALIAHQQAQDLGIQGLLRDASQLRGQVTNQGTALNFGRPR